MINKELLREIRNIMQLDIEQIDDILKDDIVDKQEYLILLTSIGIDSTSIQEYVSKELRK